MAKRDLLTEFKVFYDSQHPDAQALIRRFILTESPKQSSMPARPARAQSSSKKKGLPTSTVSTATSTVDAESVQAASGGSD